MGVTMTAKEDGRRQPGRLERKKGERITTQHQKEIKMIRAKQLEELPAEKLRWRCDPKKLKLTTTKDVDVCQDIIGQKRAMKALNLGLSIEHVGYNIFITGPVGTGRTTAVKQLLERMDVKKEIPKDWCYVNNFKNPDMPRSIGLPPGKGYGFQKDMEQLIATFRRDIPSVFESEPYQEQKKRIVEKYQKKQRATLEDFEKKVASENFKLVQVKMGSFVRPALAPVVNGNPVTLETLIAMVQDGKISQKQYDRISARMSALREEMVEIYRETKNMEKTIREELVRLNSETVLPLVKESIGEIRRKYDIKKIQLYLDEVQEQIMSELERFQQPAESEDKGSESEDLFLEYQVNLLVDNRETTGPPVILETSPNYKNLFGSIERVMDRRGVWRTDFTRIKAGSFLRANGGFLVLNARDALSEPGVWQTLKRTLRNGVVEIQTYDPFYLWSTSFLKPESIRCQVKVVMIGDAYLQRMLYFLDDDFKKIFKIKAEFDNMMPLNDRAISQYASFISMMCHREGLQHFDRSAVADVVEFGVRLAGRTDRISTRFHLVADVIREADYWAKKNRRNHVTGKHVQKAVEERIQRVNLVEEKIKERIADGTIMIDTRKRVIGQVNALSVVNLGQHTFGHPSRITATTALGRSGVINIEREAQLSGSTHDKGVLILSGYLLEKFAQDKPLSMNASLCFEQSYGGVDGDSASAAELYAILSNLSGLPVRQDVAVTGSINQKGQIQPIGGVNQKVEGFFDICRAKGLSGQQGVVIPQLNVNDLMLRRDVVTAVEKGRFHIWSVKNIDQGIEILTGVKAGRRLRNGNFPEGTVNHLANQKLHQMATALKEYGKEKK
jgi:lon-related putative ATP-dependent protease